MLVQSFPKEYEEEKFPAQLYHYVATGRSHDNSELTLLYTIGLGKFSNLSNKTVLEVGSGRGGGLSYVAIQLGPKLCVGVDFSANQVVQCVGTEILMFYCRQLDRILQGCLF